jgi:hypothetical protein
MKPHLFEVTMLTQRVCPGRFGLVFPSGFATCLERLMHRLGSLGEDGGLVN